MRALVLAAVAACAVASPVFAATTDTTKTTTTVTGTMTDADCQKALDACAGAADPKACEADLATKGCVKPAAKNN